MDYRGEVGPRKLYDVIGAQQFCVMFRLGLREHHKLIDLGCGSLRGGRLLIPYLLPGNYHGIEPNEQLIRDGIENELGTSILRVKKPKFYTIDNFRMSSLDVSADFILAQSILSHAGTDIFNTILREASKALAKNGKFAATFFEGSGPKKTGWQGHGVVSYTMDYMKKVAREHHLSVTRLDVKHPVGQKWVVFRRQ